MKNFIVLCLASLLALCGAAISAHPQSCLAADFPEREIQVIVGAAAGGLVDAAARNLAKPMEEVLGRPVVVVNKPGAGSALALTAIKNAKPDGYTIGVNPGVAYTYDPHAQKVGYTVEDFQYLAAVAQFQWAYVSASDKPWKDFSGLVAHAKKNPGMAYATMHPVGENILKFVAQKEGIQWRAIPTKGGAEVMTAILGNHVEFGYSGGIHVVHVQAGKMIVLAGHGSKRLLATPEVPTLNELGYDIVADDYIVVTTPKGVPAPIVKRLSQAVEKAAKDPRYTDLLEKKLNVPAVYVASEETLKSMRDQSAFHRGLIESVKK
jgi:tripartite-type tricarboxylate transporter receptor subunit TctC